MQLAIVLTTFIISLLTALLVFQRNPRSATNLYFALLLGFIGAYPVFNYLAIHSASDELALTYAKLILLVSIPQGPLLYFFAKTYPNSRFFFNKRRQILIICWVLVNIFLAFSGLIFKAVEVKDGVVNIQPGPLVPSFGLLHISSIIAGLTVLFKKYRQANGKEKQQLTFIFFGVLVSFTLTFIITFVLPLLLNSTLLLAVSPIFLTMSVVAAAYAIIKHKLFDIRTAAARGVAYLLAFGSIGIVYGVVVFGLINKFAHTSEIGTLQQGLYTGFALLTALIYPYIKKFFDRLSNKLFFQDAYDTQAFIDQLNKVLVTNVELQPLLEKVSEVMVANLKSEFSVFSLRETGYSPARNIGVPKASIVEFDHGSLQKAIPNIKRRVIVTDDLSDDENTKDLIKILRDNNTAVLVRLVSTLKYDLEGMGYLALGPKKSGSPYSSQDVQLIRILANELVIATENALRFEEIEKFTETLQEKVDHATKQLRQTNEKLKALDETKDEFISMASHQLRTPLTSVKGYISMVLEGDAGEISEMQRKLLDQAYVSSQRMVYLIADLLNVSRLRTGKFIIEAIPSNLADVVEGEVSQLKDTAAGRGLELTYEKPENFPTLYLDETKIRQVIMNFTDNAIYYTPRGGHINVALVEKDESIEFTVTDDGMGVPKAEQPHLFTKFYRAFNAKKARPDGTGLGLFMAKKVIISQGGGLIFKSEEGKGSTFGFSFPKAKLSQPPQQPASGLAGKPKP